MRTKTIVLSSVLAAAIGCGDDGGGTETADAGADVDGAPRPDAAPAVNSCGVRLNFESAYQNAGKLVLFHAPNGSLIGDAVTDVDGIASRADCVVGTTITVDLASGGGEPGGARYARLVTVAGVSPGDTVVFPSSNSNDYIGDVLEESDDAGFVGASSYSWSLGSGCGDTDGQVDQIYRLGVYRSCLGTDQNVDVLGLAFDGSENIIGYSSAKAVAVVPGGDANATLGTWANVSAETDITVSVSNAPLTGSSYASVQQGRDHVSFWGNENSLEPDLDGSDAFVVEALPDDFVDFHAYDISHSEYVYPQPYRRNSTRSAPNKAPSLDFGDLLPSVDGASFGVVGGSPTATFVVGGALSGIDGGAAAFTFNGPNLFGEWYVIFPAPTGNTVVLPELPKEYFGAMEGTFINPYGISFFEYGAMDYQDLLATPLDIWGAPWNGPLAADPADLTVSDRFTGLFWAI